MTVKFFVTMNCYAVKLLCDLLWPCKVTVLDLMSFILQ